MRLTSTKRSILTACSAFAILALPVVAHADADTIYSGGPILTMEGDTPVYVQAVAVEDGKITYTGDEGGLDALRGANTACVDPGGKAMLPGFVDPHGHIFLGGMQALSANLLPPPGGEGSDIAGLQRILTEWAEKNAEKVEKFGMIVGFGYDNAQLTEVRHPTREDLDAVSKDIPVIIIHQSTHIGVLNSAALAMMGYEADTPDPEGGVIRREEDGKTPNGVVEENAFFVVLPKILEGVGEAGAALPKPAVSRSMSSPFLT
ncbi:amidohydrolase family protein [Paracoccus zhejiangensis]|nr:amidohydrolase family protein [Paracoccus zhejiangensis]